MLERYSLVGVAFSLFIILLDLYLLRKRKIKSRGFVFWFLTGLVAGLFSVVPTLFSLVYVVFGTQYWISGVMGAGFCFFLLAFFYLYYRISELHSLLMKLTMEVSVARYSEKQSGPNNLKPRVPTAKRKNTRK